MLASPEIGNSGEVGGGEKRQTPVPRGGRYLIHRPGWTVNEIPSTPRALRAVGSDSCGEIDVNGCAQRRLFHGPRPLEALRFGASTLLPPSTIRTRAQLLPAMAAALAPPPFPVAFRRARTWKSGHDAGGARPRSSTHHASGVTAGVAAAAEFWEPPSSGATERKPSKCSLVSHYFESTGRCTIYEPQGSMIVHPQS
ncbi:hypothetical protein ACP70R_033793 [Stipagrostis hirtigluma subsp. patula]